MNESGSKDIFKLIASTWESAYKEQRYRDALITAISSYLMIRDHEDTALTSISVAWMRMAIEGLQNVANKNADALTTDAEQGCSFCGRKGPGVRLVAGPTAFICDSCVATASGVFASTLDE